MAADQPVQQNDPDNAQSEEDNVSLSDQIELDEEIQQDIENEINHNIFFLNQRPLLCDSGKDHDGQEYEWVDDSNL